MGSEKAGIFSSAVASVRKRFFDNFNRANQTGLGTASDGSLWRQVRGAFNISGNQAVGADNNYPMAVVDMPFSNVEIDISGASQGAAAALWVTDSGNWWSVGIDQASVTTCQTCSQVNANSGSNCNGTFNTATWNCNATSSTCTGSFNPSGTTTNSWNQIQWNPVGTNPFQWTTNSWNPTGTNPCAAWNTSNCISFTGGFCRTWRSSPPRNCIATNPVNCVASNPSNCSSPGNSFGGTPQSSFAFRFGGNNFGGTEFGGNPQTSFAFFFSGFCNQTTTNCVSPGTQNSVTCNGTFNPDVPTQWSTFSCNCSTTFPQYIRIMKSVGSVVSEVFSTTIGAVAQSFSVRTSGNQITVKAYSDPNLVTQIGSDIVHTPTGVTVVSTFGITIDPSSHNQGFSIDQVEITKN
jgi:hypothetical protein